LLNAPVGCRREREPAITAGAVLSRDWSAIGPRASRFVHICWRFVDTAYRDSNSDFRWRENDAHRFRTYTARPANHVSIHGRAQAAGSVSPLPPEIDAARPRRDTVASFRIGSGNPRGLCPNSAHPKPLIRSDEPAKPPDLQVDQPDSRARHSDCHAEGRGFESLQPLSESHLSIERRLAGRASTNDRFPSTPLTASHLKHRAATATGAHSLYPHPASASENLTLLLWSDRIGEVASAGVLAVNRRRHHPRAMEGVRIAGDRENHHRTPQLRRVTRRSATAARTGGCRPLVDGLLRRRPAVSGPP
jgi:hypothetical protein